MVKTSWKNTQAVRPSSTRTISSGAAARMSRSGGTAARKRQRGNTIEQSLMATAGGEQVERACVSLQRVAALERPLAAASEMGLCDYGRAPRGVTSARR